MFDHLSFVPLSRQLITNKEKNFLITAILWNLIDKNNLTWQVIGFHRIVI